MTASFLAKQIARVGTLHLAAAPERVFPLFTPLGESLWSPGWAPEMLSPASGEPEVGSVFITEHDQQPTGIWVMTHYAPEQGMIGYARVIPSVTAGIIRVECEQEQPTTTRATVTYLLTALSEAGNTVLAEFTEAYYQRWMASWEHAINYYLAHGRLLAHDHLRHPSE